MKVGFVPLAYFALMHNRVYHVLGDGGAIIDITAKPKNVQDSY